MMMVGGDMGKCFKWLKTHSKTMVKTYGKGPTYNPSPLQIEIMLGGIKYLFQIFLTHLLTFQLNYVIKQ